MKRIGVLFPLWIASGTLASSDPLATPDAGNPAPAAPAEEAAPVEAPPVDPIQDLIAKLADEEFKVRSEATKELWYMGEKVVDALKKASESPDPEVVHRASDLLRKIELHITPDTDEQVIELVERFMEGNASQRLDIFRSLYGAGAWHQLLKLYANEKDMELREQVSNLMSGVPVIAARERILAGDPAGARSYLEMAPADARNLLALADFHRVHGTWQEEIDKATTSNAKGAAAWLLALHRAAGNSAEAAMAAAEADDAATAALMAAYSGNPVPWLKLRRADFMPQYINLAISRWEGRELQDEDFADLEKLIAARSDIPRKAAVASLLLLGKTGPAEKVMMDEDPETMFSYFQSLERNDDAVRMLGLDPANPDFTAWFAKRFEPILEDPDETLNAHFMADVASFLEGRGMHDVLAAAMDAPLAALAEENRDGFQMLLSTLLYQNFPQLPRKWEARRTTGLPGPAIRAAINWAGEEEDRWNEIVLAIFEERSEIMEIWRWLPTLDPKASYPDRLHAILALADVGADPDLLREKWLDLAWKFIDGLPEDDREPYLQFMVTLGTFSVDAENTLRALDQLDPAKRPDSMDFDTVFSYLTATDRWQEAADLALKQGEGEDTNLTAAGRALAAGALRQAGKIEEADQLDYLVEQLALGDPGMAAGIAASYEATGQFTQAARWHTRFAHWLPAEALRDRWLTQFGNDLLQAGNWKAAAAVAEITTVLTGHSFSTDYAGSHLLLRARIASDLPKAISMLESDREKAIRMLDAAHKLLPMDGTLADDFFPVIRKVGLIAEHDEWFAQTWKLLTESISRAPNSHNTLNTAGWLASRATRQLPDAEELLKKALTLNPRQPAYLDTLAEIRFARGDREDATQWSHKAVIYQPLDSMIRRQHHRFRNDPFP